MVPQNNFRFTIFQSGAANVAKCLSEAKRLRSCETDGGNNTTTTTDDAAANKTFSFDLTEFLAADQKFFNSENLTSFNQDVPKVCLLEITRHNKGRGGQGMDPIS